MASKNNKKQPSGRAKASAKNINKVYPKGQEVNIANALEKQGVKETGKAAGKAAGKSLLRGAAGLLPFVDSAYDFGRGYYKMRNGNPIVGAGQMGVGAIEGAIDLASLLAAPETGGTGYVAGQAGKKALRQGIKAGAKKFLGSKLAKTMGNGFTRFATTAAPEMYYSMFNNDNNNQMTSSDIEQGGTNNPQTNNQQANKPNVNPYNSGGYNNGYVPRYTTDSLEKYINEHTGGNNLQDVNVQPTGNENMNYQQDGSSPYNDDSIKELLDYYAKVTGYNRPYQQELEKYIDDYYLLRRKDFNLNRYLAADKYWNNMANYNTSYNPTDVVAQKIDLINKLNTSKAKELEGAMEIIGGGKMAQYADLPVASILADDKYMKNVSTLSNAKLLADSRKYGADKRFEIAMLDAEVKRALAEGNYNKAIQLERIKGNNKLQQAFLGNLPYVQPTNKADFISAAQQFGLPVYNLVQPNVQGQPTDIRQ